jgi:diadenosine tetraphosphate (Ap4A) HIT family hydrolase
MENCYFCKSIQEHTGLDFIDELETDLFVVSYDVNPATPGHTIIIPKRHTQYMISLSEEEQQSLVGLAIKTKNYLLQADLLDMYKQIETRVAGSKSEEFIQKAIADLGKFNHQPDAFNDGLNDGAAAGQTVPHFHWHILPRWDGDVADPIGGIRHMIPGMGNYRNGITPSS